MDSNKKLSELVAKILGDDNELELEKEELIHLLLQHTYELKENKREDSFGEKLADKMTKSAGSWTFIISFCSVLVIWIIINSVMLVKPFDVYPFILLNLVLSCVAAIQAPIIMMSQNRQEEKDRRRADDEYKVNLKAELILEDLHNKLEAIIENQKSIERRLHGLEQKTLK